MVDNDGTIYIRYPDYTIKRVSPDGTVTHYAGLPDGGFGAPTNYADGTLATARFNNPQRMAKGPDGTLYVGEMYHIRAIRGQNVTTLAGRGEDSEANVFGEIRRGDNDFEPIIDGPGRAAYILFARDLWFDPDGRLMFWDANGIRTVAMDGTVTTVAYADVESEREFEKHAIGQVTDKRGNRYYPNWFTVAIQGAAMIKELPDGSQEAFGQFEAEGSQDGPLQTATFRQVTSLGYDPGRERLYTMERGVDFSLLRKITLDTPVTAQLMGEQISRQTTLHPDVMKNIMEFANAKDPKRIVLDSAANRGVALPRAGRRTRRRKANRKKKMTRKRRSTSS
jgi:hypothetical protein